MEKQYLMYIHGFMSGSNGTKQIQLKKKLKDYYNVIAPELTADPDESIKIINEMIKQYHPSVIVGTSLGGFMSLMCNNENADIFICNPCLNPYEEISRWLNEPQTYFCERIDGIQTYTLTQDVLDKYLKYNVIDVLNNNKEHIYAICSTCDDLLGDYHYKTLSNILDKAHLITSNKFDHRCGGEGFKMLVSMIKENTN